MTGEIHFGNVFRTIRERGFTGVLGMEHGRAERAVIDAYRRADAVS